MRWLFLLACLMFLGCEIPSPPPPRPTIWVELKETSDCPVALTVCYTNHRALDGRCVSVKDILSTPEEIEAYQKDVEFLTLKLREAREKLIQKGKNETDGTGRSGG